MTADLGRRDMLGLMSAAGVVFATSPAAAKRSDAFTSEVGRKFKPDGTVHPFRGNTIICHVDQQGPNSGLFEALLDIYRQLPTLGFAQKFTPLPPSSYHMTIFGGANHPERKPGLWPTSIPLDTPIEECTRILWARLQQAKLGNLAPIRMRVDLSAPVEGEKPFTIRLLPIDEAENERLRVLRNALSELFEIRAPNHDVYRFHITLAYLIRELTPNEQRSFRDFYIEQHARLAERCPVLEFGQPEYCSLEDMFHFKRLAFL